MFDNDPVDFSDFDSAAKPVDHGPAGSMIGDNTTTTTQDMSMK